MGVLRGVARGMSSGVLCCGAEVKSHSTAISTMAH